LDYLEDRTMINLLAQVLTLSGLLVLFPPVRAVAQSPDLVYQARSGDPFREGIRPTPSTGPSLNLIAALTDYQEQASRLPAQFRARFYLPDTRTPSLTIREIESRYNYWLGDLNLKENWRPQAVNEFSWSTDKVVRRLTWEGPLGLGDLAAAVRLDSSGLDSNQEDVAPVTLYSLEVPETVEGYRFVFLPNQRMRLQFQVFPDKGNQPLEAPQTLSVVLAGSPQPVAWKMGNARDGWYKLVIKGFLLSDNAGNSSVSRVVRFYHSRRFRK